MRPLRCFLPRRRDGEAAGQRCRCAFFTSLLDHSAIHRDYLAGNV
jgi:hypothetical protein